jgi:tetratricopeptide (TPR) repeat protein
MKIQRAVWFFALTGFIFWPLTIHGQEAFWKAKNDAGWKAARKNDYTEAVKLLRQAIEEAEKLGTSDPRLALSRANLAWVYNRQGEPAQADELAKSCQEILEKNAAAKGLITARTLNTLALIHQDRQEFSKSESLFLDALANLKKAKDITEDHPVAGQVQSNLAKLYDIQGRFSEAGALLRRNLKMIEQSKLGAEHPRAALCLENLASHDQVCGSFGEAETHLLRALEIRKKNAGKDQVPVSRDLNDLALLYLGQGKRNDAESLLQEAQSLAEKSLKEQPVEVALTLHNLATLYYQQKLYEKADSLFQRALDVRERSLGENDLRVAATCRGLARAQQAQNKWSEAEPLFQRSLTIQEAVLGKDHLDLAVNLDSLATVQKKQNNLVKAEQNFLRALAIRENSLGAEDRAVAASLHNLANLYKDEKKFAQAAPLYKRSLAIKEKALGTDQLSLAKVSLAKVLEDYADLLRQTNQPEEADRLDNRARFLREQKG